MPEKIFGPYGFTPPELRCWLGDPRVPASLRRPV